jgi:gamma-butyrobetaine dioxygenase
MLTRNDCAIDTLSTDSPTRLIVGWADGHESVFPSIWLLHACDCPRCGSSEIGVRHVRLTDQPARPEIRAASLADGAARLEWGDGHVSTFDPVWLRAHCLSETERLRRRPAPRPWGAEIAESLPWMDYAGLTADEDARLRFLETLRDVGGRVAARRADRPGADRGDRRAGRQAAHDELRDLRA